MKNLKFKLISIVVFLTPLASPATDLKVLSVGETFALPISSSAIVSVENGNVIQAKDQGGHVIFIAKSEGSSRVSAGKLNAVFQVVQSERKLQYESLAQFLTSKQGLHLTIDDQQRLIIQGTLLRLSDWESLKQFCHRKKIQYSFQAQIAKNKQQEIIQWMIPTLHKAGVSSDTFVIHPYPKVQLDPSYAKSAHFFRTIFDPFGLGIEINPHQLSQKPSVLMELVLAEVDQTFEQEIGILWGSEQGAGVYKTSVLPNFTNGELFAKLTALESSGTGQILARPKLLSRSGEKAEFHAGGEFPIQTSGWGSSQVEWKKYGIIMNFEPVADNQGRMNLTIETEVSIPNLNQTTGQLPIFEINRVKSHFDLDKSRTVVISGLIRTNENEFRQGVPFLSRIPVLGRLFGSPRYQTRKTELLVFVTPRILRPSEMDHSKESFE